MRRALALGYKGLRKAYPNPSVGAVVVCNGKIIGEGFTSAYGGPHAEVNAIASVQDKSLLSQSELYVTLEPCAHYGRTPPCANLIVTHKIPNVIIGCIDDNPLVSGKGIEILLKAGCNVKVGVLEKECLELHKRFFVYQQQNRPYIILKWAQSRDGFLDIVREVHLKEEAQVNWITEEFSKQQVHQLRAEEHAIMVGTNTVLNDNPSLTTREAQGENPIRIVLDRSLRIPKNYKVFDGEVLTHVFTSEQVGIGSEGVQYHQIDFSKNIIPQVLAILYQQKIQSVIVEGGAQLLQSFIDENTWDEAWQFTGKVDFGKGLKAPVFEGSLMETRVLKNDNLKIYKYKE